MLAVSGGKGIEKLAYSCGAMLSQATKLERRQSPTAASLASRVQPGGGACRSVLARHATHEKMTLFKSHQIHLGTFSDRDHAPLRQLIAVWRCPQAGLTPLMVAAKQNNMELMLALIEAKADQTAKDPEGETTLVLIEAALKKEARRLEQEEAALRLAREEPASRQRDAQVFVAVSAVAHILSALP